MGADQIAAIRPMIVELEEAANNATGVEYFARFDVPDREAAWVELILGTVNLAYPFHDPPPERLRQSGVAGLPGLALEEWQPGLFAAFAYDPATPNREVAKFIDRVISDVMGCGDDYLIDVGIAKSPPG